MIDPAAALHQAGRGNVGQIQQQARGEAEQVAGPIRFVGQHLADAEAMGTEIDRIADLQIQGLQQPLVQPDLAGIGNDRHGAGWREGLIADL